MNTFNLLECVNMVCGDWLSPVRENLALLNVINKWRYPQIGYSNKQKAKNQRKLDYNSNVRRIKRRKELQFRRTKNVKIAPSGSFLFGV